jgi:ankyrin repeat protein
MVRVLLKAGADVSCRDKFGETPLHMAVIRSQTTIVEMLLEAGADPSVQNDDQITPLHLAVLGNNTALIMSLLRSSHATCIRNPSGQTSLHLALEASQPAWIIHEIVDKTTNVNVKDDRGRTPLRLAISKSALETTKVLLEAGADLSEFADAG